MRFLSQLKKETESKKFQGWIRVHICLPNSSEKESHLETESHNVLVKFEDPDTKKVVKFSCNQIVVNLDGSNLGKFFQDQKKHLQTTVEYLTRAFKKKGHTPNT